MRLLLDTCVSPKVATELVVHGHDVIWVGDWPSDPGDEEILAFALKEGRVVVTLDKDFAELAVAFGQAHSGIIRIVNLPLSKHGTVCLGALEQHGVELAGGAIVTAEPGRLRLRPASASEQSEVQDDLTEPDRSD
jgi:predicted nuclease of predicted toxin-antitoxin system